MRSVAVGLEGALGKEADATSRMTGKASGRGSPNSFRPARVKQAKLEASDKPGLEGPAWLGVFELEVDTEKHANKVRSAPALQLGEVEESKRPTDALAAGLRAEDGRVI